MLKLLTVLAFAIAVVDHVVDTDVVGVGVGAGVRVISDPDLDEHVDVVNDDDVEGDVDDDIDDSQFHTSAIPLHALCVFIYEATGRECQASEDVEIVQTGLKKRCTTATGEVVRRVVV